MIASDTADTDNTHKGATLDLDRAVCHHFCDFKRASRVSQGQDLGIVAPFVRLEYKEYLVSDFIFVLQSFIVLFSINFNHLPGTKCLDFFPIDEYFLPKKGCSQKLAVPVSMCLSPVMLQEVQMHTFE